MELDRRITMQELSSGVTRLNLQFGFMERPLVAEGVQYAIEHEGLRCGTPEEISYYIGRETIIPTAHIPGMWVWRERSCNAMPSAPPPFSACLQGRSLNSVQRSRFDLVG